MGPPLSQGEKDGLRLRIEACWNIGSLSREAQRTSVSVQFSMTPDGMPEPDSVRLVESQGGSEAAAAQAFLRANRVTSTATVVDGGHAVEVRVRISTDTVFLGLIGIHRMSVEGQATADLVTTDTPQALTHQTRVLPTPDLDGTTTTVTARRGSHA